MKTATSSTRINTTATTVIRFLFSIMAAGSSEVSSSVAWLSLPHSRGKCGSVGYSVSDNALTGMLSSASRPRSSSGLRPRVVR